MKQLSHVAVCAAIFAATGSCCAQTSLATASSTAGSAAQIEIHGAAAKFAKVYRDADGKRIDAATFTKAIETGSDFTPTLDTGKKALTLTLKSGKATGDDLTIHVGQTLPYFHLPTVDHSYISPSQVAGKPVLVDFFFATCIACIEELPALNAYAKEHPEMQVLAVTFDDEKTAQDFVRARNFRWPVAYEGKAVVAHLGVSQYPTMLLFGAKGRLLASHTGSIPVQFSRSSNGPDVQPSKDTVKKSQLHWLNNWAAGALAQTELGK